MLEFHFNRITYVGNEEMYKQIILLLCPLAVEHSNTQWLITTAQETDGGSNTSNSLDLFLGKTGNESPNLNLDTCHVLTELFHISISQHANDW